tara:strand:+ start:1291 stop:1896 length:606 start_codon:yes stop_codon:yes gene_type:complete
MGRAIDSLIVFRFLKLLVTPFKDTKAYELGIIDERGKNLRKARKLNTEEEREAYTILHRLVFNIKKLIEKVPGGKTKLGSYAAALFLIKEHVKDKIEDWDMLEKEFYKYVKENDLAEPYEFEEEIQFTDKLTKGKYKLMNDIYTDKDTEASAKIGDIVVAYRDTPPYDQVMGVDIFPVIHEKSKEEIYVTIEDLEETDEEV